MVGEVSSLEVNNPSAAEGGYVNPDLVWWQVRGGLEGHGWWKVEAWGEGVCQCQPWESFLTNSSTHNCLGWQDLEDLERKFKDAMPQQGQVRGGD